MARPRQRTPELRDSIVKAAVEIFDLSGPDGLTTRSVATAAGTSPAAIAELLDGKPGLLTAVATEGFNRLNELLLAVKDQKQPELELVDLAMGYRRFSLVSHYLFDLMFSRPVATFGAEVAELDAIRGIYDSFTTCFGSLLHVKAEHPLAVDSATGFIALLNGLAMQERSGTLGSTSVSTDRRWTHAVQIFLTGSQAA